MRRTSPQNHLVDRVKSAHEEWVADMLATSSNRSDSRLDLSSIRVTDTSGKTDSSAVLDLMVRNIGDQPAIIHRAVIHIRDALGLSPYHAVCCHWLWRFDSI